MEFFSCLEVIICVIIGFLLCDFWPILLWFYGVIIQYGHRNENRSVPVEHEQDQREVYKKKLVNQGNKKETYFIIKRLLQMHIWTAQDLGFRISDNKLYINKSLIPKLRELLSEVMDKKLRSVPRERRQSVDSNHFLCKHE